MTHDAPNIPYSEFDCEITFNETSPITPNKTLYTMILDLFKPDTKAKIGTAVINGTAFKIVNDIYVEKASNWYFNNGDTYTSMCSGKNIADVNGFFTVKRVREKIMYSNGRGNMNNLVGWSTVIVLPDERRRIKITKQ